MYLDLFEVILAFQSKFCDCSVNAILLRQRVEAGGYQTIFNCPIKLSYEKKLFWDPFWDSERYPIWDLKRDNWRDS